MNRETKTRPLLQQGAGALRKGKGKLGNNTLTSAKEMRQTKRHAALLVRGVNLDAETHADQHALGAGYTFPKGVL